MRQWQAAYGNDHSFLDSLALLEGTWYFAATNAKEQVFVEYPGMTFPKTRRGRLRKHPMLTHAPTSVQDIAQTQDEPWWQKGPRDQFQHRGSLCVVFPAAETGTTLCKAGR